VLGSLVDYWMLFDKWFEERETQAAESWRIRGRARARWRIEQTLAISAFQAITMRIRFGVTQARCNCVKVPVTQRFLGLNLQANQNRNFQLESLILAQNERWRQA
jgi:hypothetical protein